MGRKTIPINLKTTSPEGVVMRFKMNGEAAEGLGFSQRGVGKTYHTGKSRIGDYRSEWLEPESVKVDKIIKKLKEAIKAKDCIYCGKPLNREDRIDYGYGFGIMRLGEDGHPVEDYFIKSMYEANKRTGLSYPALINAAEKGNASITRRRDKAKYLFSWGGIHKECFEIRKRRRIEGKEQVAIMISWKL